MIEDAGGFDILSLKNDRQADKKPLIFITPARQPVLAVNEVTRGIDKLLQRVTGIII